MCTARKGNSVHLGRFSPVLKLLALRRNRPCCSSPRFTPIPWVGHACSNGNNMPTRGSVCPEADGAEIMRAVCRLHWRCKSLLTSVAKSRSVLLYEHSPFCRQQWLTRVLLVQRIFRSIYLTARGTFVWGMSPHRFCLWQ